MSNNRSSALAARFVHTSDARRKAFDGHAGAPQERFPLPLVQGRQRGHHVQEHQARLLPAGRERSDHHHPLPPVAPHHGGQEEDQRTLCLLPRDTRAHATRHILNVSRTHGTQVAVSCGSGVAVPSGGGSAVRGLRAGLQPPFVHERALPLLPHTQHCPSAGPAAAECHVSNYWCHVSSGSLGRCRRWSGPTPGRPAARLGRGLRHPVCRHFRRGRRHHLYPLRVRCVHACIVCVCGHARVSCADELFARQAPRPRRAWARRWSWR